ncbi:unnamed protein product [Camellia sinensis]
MWLDLALGEVSPKSPKNPQIPETLRFNFSTSFLIMGCCEDSVNERTSAGCKVKIWIADWFAQLNNKIGG